MSANYKGSLPPHQKGNDNNKSTSVTQKSLDRCAYTTGEAAQKLAVSTKTIYRWIERGLLPTSTASRKFLIPAKAVENFMENTK